MAFLGQEEQIREFQERFRVLYAVAFIAIALLTLRLVYLQVITGDRMRQLSEENRIKRVKVAAPRGMIFDRNNALLIDNRPAFDVEIIPQYMRESRRSDEVIARLSKLISTPEAEIRATLEKARTQPSFLPVKIKNDLSRDEVASIETWKISLPGVEVREEIKRTNLQGEIAAHLLGYIGEVNATELPVLNKKGRVYKLGDNIGKFGLEQRMEEVLRGQDGEELKEVDALGRAKLDRQKGRVLSTEPDKPAMPGTNLKLTIDQDLQLAAWKAFEDKIGSIVALDPHSGQVLAMLSKPSFDPTEFSRGIAPGTWSKLLNNENRPMRDRTIQDHYPPGSTFKIVTAIAGLEEKAIDERTTFSCSGFIRVGNRLMHCHKREGHGSVNVVQALSQSCDVFFYRMAQRLKSVDDIAKWATLLGLGRRTGINLAREATGLVPTEEWKQKRFGQPWTPGETLNISIGQGYLLVTALQLANLYATIGNGGTLYRPYLVKAIQSYDGQMVQEGSPEVIGKVTITPKTLALVLKGIWGVVNDQHGTAYRQRLPGMDMAGKSGTAQVIRLSKDRLFGRNGKSQCMNFRFKDRHHGLFVALAPADDPKIAVAVIAEHGCSGGMGAAPIVRSVVKTYLQKYYPQLYSDTVLAAQLKGADALMYKAGAEAAARAAAAANSAEEEDLIIDADSNLRLPVDTDAPDLPGGE